MAREIEKGKRSTILRRIDIEDGHAEYLECPLEQVRIPFVVPAQEAEGDLVESVDSDSQSLRPLLIRAGIIGDSGTRVAVIAPLDQRWYLPLTQAIRDLSGELPYLIQTESQRASIANHGPLRVIDMQGLCPQ